MARHVLQDRPPQFRLTLLVLGIALAGIWYVSLYTIQVFREDLRQTLAAQQLSTASFIAEQVNDELQDRLRVLATVAGRVSPAILAKRSAAQAFLRERLFLPLLFNGGTLLIDTDATAVADFPVVPGRVGTNYKDRESVTVPLKEGRSVIGRPSMGKALKAPVFSIVVPIRDSRGKVIGAIAGTINLGLPNFLDKLARGRYGQSGGYLLIAPQYRLVVTASDRQRVMETLPAEGVNSELDRLLGSRGDTIIFVNPKGVEVMGSVAGIPVAGWLAGVAVPTQEAFAAISVLEQRVFLVAALTTLLACILTWWLLKNQQSVVLAFFDPLTHLANRRLMEDRLNQAIVSSRRNATRFAVMLLDLDNFKPLNDTHGHIAGDLLLIEAARRLKQCVRDSDTVARFGGDEFVVILSDLDADDAVATSQALAVAEKMRIQLAEPYLLKIHQRGKSATSIEHRCTTSIGVVVTTSNEARRDDLIKQADAAMYAAKEAGRDQIRLHEKKQPS